MTTRIFSSVSTSSSASLAALSQWWPLLYCEWLLPNETTNSDNRLHNGEIYSSVCVLSFWLVIVTEKTSISFSYTLHSVVKSSGVVPSCRGSSMLEVCRIPCDDQKKRDSFRRRVHLRCDSRPSHSRFLADLVHSHGVQVRFFFSADRKFDSWS